VSDLEDFINQPGRAERVREVGKFAAGLGVELIYFQYISVTGRIIGKAIPIEHWEAIAQKGVQTVYGAVTHAFADRHGEFLGFDTTQSELVAIPEPETFCQLPWNKAMGRVFCTLFRNREDRENPGGIFTADCRGNLRRASQRLAKDHDSLQLRLGCEPEMLWLNRGPDGKPDGGPTKPYAYHIDQFEILSGVVLSVHRYSKAMGLDMIQADHEDAPGMMEQNWQYDDCLRTADRLTTFRQICAQVARENNLIACFMAKSVPDLSGNGCHHNMSLWHGGADESVMPAIDPLPGSPEIYAYSKGGRNVYASEEEGLMPSALGLNCIAGIVKHLPAMTAIGCSTVNSYRRLMDTGLWAPVFADWGLQNRTCALRISSPERMEYRAVDAMVNPYLMSAVMLAALDDGLKNDLDAGEPEMRSAYELRAEGKAQLPMNLGEALDALDADEVIKAALPGDMYRCFTHYKRDEWERFNATLTEWDIDTYIDCLP
jgi:glutamine synthetase